MARDAGCRPRFARLAVSPLPRGCIALTKSEEKERLLAVYIEAGVTWQVFQQMWRVSQIIQSVMNSFFFKYKKKLFYSMDNVRTSSTSFLSVITTVFLDTRLSKSKHPLKRFQNFRQSYTSSYMEVLLVLYVLHSLPCFNDVISCFSSFSNMRHAICTFLRVKPIFFNSLAIVDTWIVFPSANCIHSCISSS